MKVPVLLLPWLPPPSALNALLKNPINPLETAQ